MTEPQTADTLADALVAAAAELRRAFPAADGWTVERIGAAALLPAPGSRAVRAALGPASLLVLADPGVSRLVQVGPPPADDLVEGCGPALEALARALTPLLPGATLAAAEEVDPATLELEDVDLAAVALNDADVHRVTLLVLVPAADRDAPTVTEPVASRATAVPPRGRSAVDSTGLDLLHDVELAVTAELGRTRLLVREVLDLVPGSVIELDRTAGSPVDVLVNGTLIARGEVVVIDEEYGIRITEVVGHEDDRAR